MNPPAPKPFFEICMRLSDFKKMPKEFKKNLRLVSWKGKPAKSKGRIRLKTRQKK